MQIAAADFRTTETQSGGQAAEGGDRMIELKSVTKKYGKHTIVSDVNCVYREGQIYGLIGYNGSGKTTLLKTVAGIFRPDGGEILADGISTAENESYRRNSFLMTEELFFEPQSTPDGMRRLYRGYYPSWNDDVYERLLRIFGLDRNAKIVGFSKGMQRQTGLLLALSVMPKYLFLDETFDGLDMAKRNMLARILKNYIAEKNALVIVTSHYLKELEHIADEVGMIDGERLIAPDTEGKSLESYFLEKSEVDEDEIEGLFGGSQE